jgi:Ca2+-binding EF-hand superfamily protein
MLILTEERCEMLKQRLAKRKNFDFDKAFEAIDRGSKGNITSEDLLVFLIQKGFVATNEQVGLFFSRLDKYKTTLPKKEDFINELKPKTDVEYI